MSGNWKWPRGSRWATFTETPTKQEAKHRGVNRLLC